MLILVLVVFFLVVFLAASLRLFLIKMKVIQDTNQVQGLREYISHSLFQRPSNAPPTYDDAIRDGDSNSQNEDDIQQSQADRQSVEISVINTEVDYRQQGRLQPAVGKQRLDETTTFGWSVQLEDPPNYSHNPRLGEVVLGRSYGTSGRSKSLQSFSSLTDEDAARHRQEMREVVFAHRAGIQDNRNERPQDGDVEAPHDDEHEQPHVLQPSTDSRVDISAISTSPSLESEQADDTSRKQSVSHAAEVHPPPQDCDAHHYLDLASEGTHSRQRRRKPVAEGQHAHDVQSGAEVLPTRSRSEAARIRGQLTEGDVTSSRGRGQINHSQDSDSRAEEHLEEDSRNVNQPRRPRGGSCPQISLHNEDRAQVQFLAEDEPNHEGSQYSHRMTSGGQPPVMAINHGCSCSNRGRPQLVVRSITLNEGYSTVAARRSANAPRCPPSYEDIYG